MIPDEGKIGQLKKKKKSISSPIMVHGFRIATLLFMTLKRLTRLLSCLSALQAINDINNSNNNMTKSI